VGLAEGAADRGEILTEDEDFPAVEGKDPLFILDYI
jgi:hypothetical protein